MKKRCVVCNEAKGKRACSLHEGEQVCPRCCASIRSDDCMGCSYHTAAQRYQTEKLTELAAKGEREKTFTVEINPQLDDEIDAALTMIEAGKFRKGERIIRAISKQYPNYHNVMYANGIVHLKQDKIDEALACFNAAVEIFPPLTEAHFNIGSIYLKRNDIPGAVRAYKKVVEYGDPEEPYVRHARETVIEIERKVREAEGVDLNTYLFGSDLFVKANEYMAEKKWQLSIDGFRRVLSLVPRHHQSLGNLGICYAMLGQKKRALEALDRALELNPSYEFALLNRPLIERLDEGEPLS